MRPSILLVVFFLSLFLPVEVTAQLLCGNHGEVIETLEKRFQEKMVALGITAEGYLMEILTSSEGTWTILYTAPNKPTCVIDTGDGFELLKELKELKGSPA